GAAGAAGISSVAPTWAGASTMTAARAGAIAGVVVVVTVVRGGASSGGSAFLCGVGIGATGISATGGTAGGLAAAAHRADVEASARTAQAMAGRTGDRDGMRPPVCLLRGAGQILGERPPPDWGKPEAGGETTSGTEITQPGH